LLLQCGSWTTSFS